MAIGPRNITSATSSCIDHDFFFAIRYWSILSIYSDGFGYSMKQNLLKNGFRYPGGRKSMHVLNIDTAGEDGLISIYANTIS